MNGDPWDLLAEGAHAVVEQAHRRRSDENHLTLHLGADRAARRDVEHIGGRKIPLWTIAVEIEPQVAARRQRHLKLAHAKAEDRRSAGFRLTTGAGAPHQDAVGADG